MVRPAIISLALIVSPLAAVAQDDYYGALAYSFETKQVFGINSASSERQATRSAMAGCQKVASDCEEMAWFRNACGAVAIDEGGDGGFGTSWGLDRNEASSKAMGECLAAGNTNCRVRTVMCTPGYE